MGEENAMRPKPFPSWVWDDTLNFWTSPVPLVREDKNQSYDWDEETISWVKLPLTGSI
jgi:hypothetical protein